MKVVKPSHRLFSTSILLLIGILLICAPVLAIANPANIEFGTGTDTYYKVFYDVLEEGDWLVVAEGFVNYTTEPTDYTAEQAYLFEIVNIAGNETLASTTLQAYGDRPISIYLSASRVTSLSLTSGAPYIVRIMGNPLIFPASSGNTVNVTLGSEDYVDQDLGADGAVPTANPLRNGMIVVANNMEDNDSPTTSYITTVQGYTYLSTTGADLFLAGIPSLYSMCPILFAAGSEPMTSEPPESTGAYAQTLTATQKWGETVGNGLTQLGSYLGISTSLAGSVMLFALAIAFAVYIYQRTQSGITVLLMISAVPFLGSYLGLMTLAVTFMVVIIIVVLLGYFFFSRGAL
jgi:hypothetical protein